MLYEVAIYLTWKNGAGLWSIKYYKTQEEAKKLKPRRIYRKGNEYGLQRCVVEYTDSGYPTFIPPPPIIKPKRSRKKK